MQENLFNQDFISEEHSEALPTVRIKKAVLKDFKSVEYGEIVMNCGRQFVPYNTEADILGIYGQNGSGKTAFIEALSILRSLMVGGRVSDVYSDCIPVDKDHSELSFVFDLQYKNGVIREAVYSFSIRTEKVSEEELIERFKDAPDGFEKPEEVNKIVVFNEKLQLSWEESSKRQDIIDVSSQNVAFVPSTKRKILAGNSAKTAVDLEVNRRLASSQSRSFIFMKENIALFSKFDYKNIFFQVLVELRYFAREYLFVVDTKSSGFIRLNVAQPIYTPTGRMMIHNTKPMIVPKEEIASLEKQFEQISIVLNQLVPGLTLKLKIISDTLDRNGEDASSIMVVAVRDGKILPLRDESDGVRKIVAYLALIVEAFNQQSVTIAIDEFDAGIFEYLLGEILQAFEEYGKGQFIFTSHNLRPLEVISKKYLYFTTSNPQNRYIRLKNVASSNNLRDTYFREIVMDEQDEKIYNRTKRFKIVAALKKARGRF